MRRAVLVVLLAASLLLNVLTVAVASVSAAVSAVFEGVTGVGSAVGGLRGALGEARDSLKQKDAQIGKLEQQVELGRQKLARLEGEIAARQPREVNYRGQRRTLSQAVDDTTNRVSRRISAGASRNLAAMFGEAVPVWGVAVVVGVTAWELKDACDTMKDLHELEVALDPSRANSTGVSEVCGMVVPTKEALWEKVKASPAEAWRRAREALPELPELVAVEIDWKFWD